MKKSRYYAFHELGGPDVLVLHTEEVGEPGAGEVRIRHAAVGVNFTDVNLRRGEHPEPVVFPARIGQEAAGVIEAVGPGVTGFEVGDRVVYATRPLGAYAERRVLAADRLVPVPAHVTLEEAAAGLLKGMTAEYLIHRCFRVQPGTRVVFYAAAGGVGRIACRWLAHLGAEVVGVVGSRAKLAAAYEAGCREVVVFPEEDLPARVRAITDGAMADVVYDSLGAVSFEASLSSLRPRGTLVAFGSASGPIPPTAPLVLGARGSLYMTWPRIGDYTRDRAELLASARRLFDARAAGHVELEPTARFPFEDAVAAHRALETRATTGALVLTIDASAG